MCVKSVDVGKPYFGDFRRGGYDPPPSINRKNYFLFIGNYTTDFEFVKSFIF